MYFIGSDLHKKTITLHVVDQARRTVASRRFSCSDTGAMIAWIMQFIPFRIVVEATASYEWFVQLVEPFADRVVLVHVGELRVIAVWTRKSGKLEGSRLTGVVCMEGA